MATKGKKLNSMMSDEHDAIEYRKRVTLAVDGTTVSYEDTNFTSADSPAVLDVKTDLGRFGHEGQVICDSLGRIKVEISTDGVNYGGLHTLRGGEVMNLNNLKVHKIRLTYVEPTAYRVRCA